MSCQEKSLCRDLKESFGLGSIYTLPGSDSGLYSSNVLIFFPSENLLTPNVKRFRGKILGISQAEQRILKHFLLKIRHFLAFWCQLLIFFPKSMKMYQYYSPPPPCGILEEYTIPLQQPYSACVMGLSLIVRPLSFLFYKNHDY